MLTASHTDIIVKVYVNPPKPHGFHLLESISKSIQVCLQWQIPLAGLTTSELRSLLHKITGFDIRPYVKSLFHYSWRLFEGRCSFWWAIEQTSFSNVHLKWRISQPGPREAFSLWRFGTNAGTDVDGAKGCGCYKLWRCFLRFWFMWCVYELFNGFSLSTIWSRNVVLSKAHDTFGWRV